MSPADTFEDREGKKKAYLDYYREVYNITNISEN